MSEVEQGWTDPVAPTAAPTQEVKPKKEKKAKEPKVAKEPKAPKEPKVRGESKKPRGSNKFPNTAVISLLVTANPKKAGSNAAADWEKYTNGMTVQDAIDREISLADLYYNASHSFIAIEGYDAPVPIKKPRPAKAEVPAEQPAA